MSKKRHYVSGCPTGQRISGVYAKWYKPGTVEATTAERWKQQKAADRGRTDKRNIRTANLPTMAKLSPEMQAQIAVLAKRVAARELRRKYRIAQQAERKREETRRKVRKLHGSLIHLYRRKMLSAYPTMQDALAVYAEECRQNSILNEAAKSGTLLKDRAGNNSGFEKVTYTTGEAARLAKGVSRMGRVSIVFTVDGKTYKTRTTRMQTARKLVYAKKQEKRDELRTAIRAADKRMRELEFGTL